MKYKVRVTVRLKPEYGDPNAHAIRSRLMAGYAVREVRTGKVIELEVDFEPENLEATIQAMCETLLANPTIETYEYRIFALVEQPNGIITTLPLAPWERLDDQTAEKIVEPVYDQYYLASLRPSNYLTLSSREQWAVDKRLGILDWDGR